MPVDEIGDASKPRLQVIDRQMGKLPFALPVEALNIPENCARTAIDRIANEAPSVLVRAGIRGKGVARTHAAAVGRDAGDRHRESGQQRRNLGIRRGRDCRGVVHVSSRTSPLSAGSCGWLIGASVGTPSRRRAAPMTLLNTGAATLPP